MAMTTMLMLTVAVTRMMKDCDDGRDCGCEHHAYQVNY